MRASITGEKVRFCGDHPRHPTAPKVTDHVATPLRHRRNFVQKNAIDAMISSAQAIPDPLFVDNQHGNTQSLVKSGMVPSFSQKKVQLVS